MSTQEFVEREKRYTFPSSDENGAASLTIAAIGKADSVGDTFLAGSFAKEIGKTVPMLAAHQLGPNPPLGSVKITAEGKDSVKADSVFNSTTLAQEWRKAAKETGSEVSVRIRARKGDYEFNESTSGMDFKRVKVMEVSLTPLGAQPGTGVSRVKADAPACEPSAIPPTLASRSVAKTELLHRTLSA